MSACPVPDCTAHTQPGRLLCLPHWRLVPYPLQKDVWNTWRAYTKASGADALLAARKPYYDAREAAIAEVVRQESPLCD